MSEPKAKPRVLVVDDDVDNVELLERILRAEFDVLTETKPGNAVDVIRNQTLDLIIVDQRMPECSGTTLLARALELQPDARRVILSAFTDAEDLIAGINRCRIHRFLSKPVDREELLACARALTSSKLRNPVRTILVDRDLVRGQQLAKELEVTSGGELEVFSEARVSSRDRPGLVILSEPAAVEDVQEAVAALGGVERSTVIFVLVPPDAVNDAAFYLRAGVEDVIWPPHRAAEIALRFRTWRARRNAEAEIERLRAEVVSRSGYFELIGHSAPMQAVFASIAQVARSDASVLLLGETGTGKELVARAIHAASPRRDAPFVPVALSAIPETLVEAELFGHEAGAFTGANRARAGRLESAHGGTLFLDEVGDLAPAVQVKLLRVLQEREYQPVGSSRSRSADFRLVCATHRDLEELVATGGFRQDLFYRINVVRIDLPPLRERREDIPLLARAFLQRFCRAAGKTNIALSEAALSRLVTHDWPGNVRELEHALERAVALSQTNEILDADILTERVPRRSFRGMVDNFSKGGRDLDELMADVERTVLLETMQRFKGNQSAVARKLQIPRSTLRSRLRRYGL